MTARAPGGSFTEGVLAELAPHLPPLPHCRAALLEGMVLATAATADPGVIETTRAVTARCAVALLHADGRGGHAVKLRSARGHRYRVAVPPGDPAPGNGNCCRRSRLRGAFLVRGLVNRPDRSPHLEVPARDHAAAQRLVDDLAVFEVPATVVARRGRPVVTVRTAAAVGTALSCIGAQSARLAYEEGRVVRDVRSGVNRTLNAETANLRRTVDAAVRQLEAVATLSGDGERWEQLPPALREAALLRRANPDDSLARLAERAGVSRPALAGRLHRLVDLASR